jgi:RNA ligase
MLPELKRLIEDGYISRRKHPSEELYILNYTPKTQYEGMWNETTSLCRGLIVDGAGKIRARCFPKFFNYEECLDLVHERIGKNLGFTVSEKMDGSLGILYWVGGKPFIATRGSFESEQALRANEILSKWDASSLDQGLTYLFEIIYPENRICVDYGTREELVFLSAYEIDSGLEVNPDHPFPSAARYEFGPDFGSVKKLNLENREGFVVRFEDGYRFKIKFEDYVRLHSVIFSVSSRSVWNSLRHGQEIPLDDLPDEIYGWIKGVKEQLLSSYNSLEKEAKELFSGLVGLDRKEFAAKALEYRCSSILFKMLDGRPYDDLIWKMIEPEYKTPRHNEEI